MDDGKVSDLHKVIREMQKDLLEMPNKGIAEADKKIESMMDEVRDMVDETEKRITKGLVDYKPLIKEAVTNSEQGILKQLES